MTNQIAIIDPYVKTPAIHCFNGLVELLQKPLNYYHPSQFGISDLLQDRHKICAYIVLGSASHVHENLPWHMPLANFLVEELQLKKPILGCCFGHQLICHTFGSRVHYYSDENFKFRGLRKIEITEPFWNFLKNESFSLAVSHKQVVSHLGPGLKAVGFGLTNDIVIHEKLPFLGVQAHPEASHYFCTNDIKVMTEQEVQLARADGDKLILRFFKHFHLI